MTKGSLARIDFGRVRCKSEIRSRLSRFEYMDPTVWKRSMNVWDGAEGRPPGTGEERKTMGREGDWMITTQWDHLYIRGRR